MDQAGLFRRQRDSYSSDMFAEMSVAFYIAAALAQNRNSADSRTYPRPQYPRRAEAATVNGANCAGSQIMRQHAAGKEATGADPLRRHISGHAR